MKKHKTASRLTGSIVLIVVLAVCLAVTTFALVYASVSVNNNLFQTGEVHINLNDGKPIIRESEFLFEPGMTVNKGFFVKNESSCDIYYRVYFDNISGGLADVLEVTIRDGEKTLYSGKASELTRKNVIAADDLLKIDEKRTLTASFHFPEESGNEAQNLSMSFTLCAEATQTKNNPNRLFD